MFTIPPGAWPFAARSSSPARGPWRDAAALVWSRWDMFLVAPPASRAVAFAAYVAALDAEAAAARELAEPATTPRRVS
jgi:hypothetical protein